MADGSDPQRAANAARPAFHKYASTGFVADFLTNPQRSVVFDPSIDVLQRVEPIPAAQLLTGDGRWKSLSSTRLVPTETRKLFLAAHQRFYLVAVGLNCDRAGFPMVDPDTVAEVGFVVRRRRMLVPGALVPTALTLMHGISQARAATQVRFQLDAAKQRSRLLHPFRSSTRDRVAAPRAATLAAATALLTRALQIGLDKDDVEWLHNSEVKAQMKRMDPSFSEKALGFKSFSDFLRSRAEVVELDETSTTRLVKLR